MAKDLVRTLADLKEKEALKIAEDRRVDILVSV
jgi:hypothetical protein